MAEDTALDLVRALLEEEGDYEGDLATLSESLEEFDVDFNLGPDAFADVKRMPATVRTIDDLMDYLMVLKGRISQRPSLVPTADWDVAKSGDLKLYKMYVCCGMALKRFLTANAGFVGTPSDIANAVIRSSTNTRELNLSDSGMKLWTAVFGNGSIRAKSVILHYLSLTRNEAIQRPIFRNRGARAQNNVQRPPVDQAGNEDEEEEADE